VEEGFLALVREYMLMVISYFVGNFIIF